MQLQPTTKEDSELAREFSERVRVAGLNQSTILRGFLAMFCARPAPVVKRGRPPKVRP